MNWTFINNELLIELTTGFQLWLVRGTWDEPQEIKPIISESLGKIEATRFIRLGVEHARKKYSKYNREGMLKAG